MYVRTLYLKSLSGLSSVCYKTTQIAGGVGGNGAAPPTSKLGTFLSWPLALSMSIYSNFQINEASGEILHKRLILPGVCTFSFHLCSLSSPIFIICLNSVYTSTKMWLMGQQKFKIVP